MTNAAQISQRIKNEGLVSLSLDPPSGRKSNQVGDLFLYPYCRSYQSVADCRNEAVHQSPGLAVPFAANPGGAIDSSANPEGVECRATLTGLIHYALCTQGRPQKAQPTLGFDALPFQGSLVFELP